VNEQYREAMGKALFLANRARETGDVPVGAVVVDENGRIIGRGWNCREAHHDPAGHAEIVALREAGRPAGGGGAGGGGGGHRESTGPARTDDSRVHGPLDSGSFVRMRTSRLRPATPRAVSS